MQPPAALRLGGTQGVVSCSGAEVLETDVKAPAPSLREVKEGHSNFGGRLDIFTSTLKLF